MNRSFKSVELNTALAFSLSVKIEMTNGSRRTGFYGVAGVLLASIIIIGFVAGNNLLFSGTGTLKIRIMDKPVDLQYLYLTIDWIRIQNQDDGKWVELYPQVGEFDLLALQIESVELSDDEVPGGSYSKVWLHVVPETARAVFDDGTEKNLKVPSEIIKIFFNPSINIEYDEATTVLIDLQPEWDSIAVSDSLNLRPVVKAVVTP